MDYILIATHSTTVEALHELVPVDRTVKSLRQPCANKTGANR